VRLQEKGAAAREIEYLGGGKTYFKKEGKSLHIQKGAVERRKKKNGVLKNRQFLAEGRGTYKKKKKRGEGSSFLPMRVLGGVISAPGKEEEDYDNVKRVCSRTRKGARSGENAPASALCHKQGTVHCREGSFSGHGRTTQTLGERSKKRPA